MKKFIKLSLVLVALLAIVFTFAACGNTEEQTSTEVKELYDGFKIAWNTDATVKGSAYRGLDGLTTRMSAADGTYRARFAIDGEQVDLFFPDMASMSLADNYPFVAVKYDENNVVTDCKSVLDVTGGFSGWNYFIESVTDTEIVCNSVGNFKGVPLTIKIDENTKTYDISGTGLLVGLPGVAAPGGRVYAILNHDGVASHLFVTGAFQTTPVYWNITRMYDTTSKITTRERDATGYFVYDFVVDGQVIQLKTMDADVANQVDSFAAKAMHLKFNEDGTIAEALHASNSTGGGSKASWYHVMEYVAIEKRFFAEKFSGSDKGDNGNYYMTNDCKVYDVSGQSPMGSETELRVGDHIHCLSNPAGDVCIVFVHGRSQDVELYYNVDRQWNDSAKKSTRRADGDGWYHFTMSVNGQHVQLKTQDATIVETIDGRAAKVLGLALDGDVITAAYVPSAVTGRNSTAFDYTVVKSINGDEVVTERNGKTYVGRLSNNCEIYNVSSVANRLGEKTKIQVGDTLYGLSGLDKKVNEVYVTKRAKDSYLYWNNDRNYDTTNKVSNRKPSADGYYYLEFFNVDKDRNEIFRTNNKALVDKIDSYVAVGLTYDGQDIVEAFKYDMIRGIGGSACSWKTVEKITYNKVTAGGETCTISSHMKTYNVSSSAIVKGEETELRVGDKIHGIKDTRGKVVYMFVVTRPVEADLYYNIDRKWDSASGTSTRVPTGEGCYEFTMAVNGQQVSLYTYDKSIVNTIDGRAAKVLGLVTSEDGEILKAYLPSSVTGSENTAFDYSTVTEIKDDGTIVTTRFGNTYTGKPAADCKTFNVSGSATKIGEVTTVEVNDQLYGFSNKKGEVTAIFVVSRVVKAQTKEAYCSACDADVEWAKWTGDAFADGHYYLAETVNMTKAVTIAAGTTVCLNLNGKDILGSSSQDRMFNIYGVFNLFDEKKEDGTFDGDIITCYDNASSTRVGNIFYIQNEPGAEFNMYGGNMKSTGTVTKGKIGGITRPMNIYDGTISGGKVTGYGGALRVESGNGKLNIYGGEITAPSGTVAAGGGLIYISSGEINVYGGKLTGGTVSGSGATICVEGANAKVNISGGEVIGGSAKNGGNIHVVKGSLTISGGTITAGTASNGNTLCLFGGTATTLVLKNKVNLQGVFLYTNNMITAQNLSTDSLVTLSMEAPGVFATFSSTAEAEKYKNCFKSSGSLNVSVSGSSLNLGEGGSVTPPVTETHTHCVCGGNTKGVGKHTSCTEVDWTAWTGTVADGGKYYLTKDISVSSTITIAKDTNVSLCLNGYKITGGSSLNRIFNVYGTLNICDHKVDGKYKGEIISTVTNTEKTGGVFYTQNGSSIGYGVVNLYGGTLKATGQLKNGAICGLGNDFNMYDGTLSGGNASSMGGNVYMEKNSDSEFNMYGGLITGGYAGGGGGNIRAGNICNLLGGTIENGTGKGSGGNMRIDSGTTTINGTNILGGTSTQYNGGNIFTDSATLVIKSGTIANGTAVNGGNINIKKTGSVISGGTIYGGTASGMGDDIYFEKDGGTLTLSGVIGTNGVNLKVHVKLGSLITTALDPSVKITVTEG